MTQLHFEDFVLPPDETYPLFVTAKRYWPKDLLAAGLGGKGDGKVGRGNGPASGGEELTLLVLHSTSFHKETWEASLETLFGLATLNSGGTSARSVPIREAWSIECPNHGQSATLNEQVLATPEYANDFSCERYANAVHRFLTKGPVSFFDHNLVGIGHSLGANTILLLQFITPLLPFTSLIIVEPMVSPDGTQYLEELRTRLVAAAKKRRDSWATREDVKVWLEGQKEKGRKRNTGRWDGRVIDAFVKYGIRAVTVTAPSVSLRSGGHTTTKFMLACTRRQEIAMYLDRAGPTAPVYALNRISSQIPVHLVLGKIKDFIPKQVHDALIDPASGRKYASIVNLPDVGHLIPQEQPDALAAAIHKAILQTYSNTRRTKL